MRKLSLSLAAAALLATAATNETARAADHEVVIGFAIAQSGWMNAYDGPPMVGAQMAIEEFNAKGGILGKPIRAETGFLPGGELYFAPETESSGRAARLTPPSRPLPAPRARRSPGRWCAPGNSP